MMADIQFPFPGAPGPRAAGSHPGPREAEKAPGRGAQFFRRLWARVRTLHDRINDCWIGDLIGVVSLFALLFIALIIGGALQ